MLNPSSRRGFARGLMFLALSTTAVVGQTVPTTSSLAPTATDEPVTLTPFVVAESEDHGYAATSTLAGTRLRTELRDVGAAISVVTSQFMIDTASTG